MMQVLTDEQALEVRDRQVERVAEAIRQVTAAHPGTEPLALTMMIQVVGGDASILGPTDFAAARIAARPEREEAIPELEPAAYEECLATSVGADRQDLINAR